MIIKQIKVYLLGLILSIVFVGCYGAVAGNIAESTGILPNPDDGKVYLEKLDNDEFLEYILEKKLINNLTKRSVIYIDNAYVGGANSSKLVFSKEFMYRIITGKEYEDIKKYELGTNIFVSKFKYYEKEAYLHTEIGNSFSSKELFIFKLKLYPKWYEKKKKYLMGIKSRYNNIHKIKEIIDERVAYFKSLENNETN